MSRKQGKSLGDEFCSSFAKQFQKWRKEPKKSSKNDSTIVEQLIMNPVVKGAPSVSRYVCCSSLQACRRGGSKGLNQPPLKFNSGGLQMKC